MPSLDAALAAARLKLDSPHQIQGFVDTLVYSADDRYRCPLTVLADRTAHCYDGAVLAAALLRRLGHRPRILDMLPNERDDDHLLALFQQHGRWGAVAKSNFSGLRYREPIYRTLRELVLSYFEDYFNSAGEKTLRAYTMPLDLRRFDRLSWETRDAALDDIAAALERIRKIELLTPAMVAGLAPVDPRALAAGLMGAREEGLFKLSERAGN